MPHRIFRLSYSRYPHVQLTSHILPSTRLRLTHHLIIIRQLIRFTNLLYHTSLLLSNPAFSLFCVPYNSPRYPSSSVPPLPTPLLRVIFGGAAGTILNRLSFISTHPISHVPYCPTTLLHIISPSSFPNQPSSCSCCY